MGLDMKAHIEVLINDKWMYYSPADFVRDYDLYDKIGNPGNDNIKPACSSFGFPSDASEMTKIHRGWSDGCNVHCEGLLSSEEFCSLGISLSWSYYRDAVCRGHIYLFGNAFDKFYEFKEDYPDFVQDFRVVFWFER